MRNELTAQEIVRVSNLLRAAAVATINNTCSASQRNELKKLCDEVHAQGRLDDPQAYLDSLNRALSTHWLVGEIASSKSPLGTALYVDALPDDNRRKAYRLERDLGM